MEKLLTALSYTGIGGKKSGGLGKYRYNEGQIPEQLLECLQKKSDRYMLLSVALPADEELWHLQIMQRSGEKRRIFMYLQQVPVL